MEEVLECGECGDVFSSEETLEKHANFEHNGKDVKFIEGGTSKGIFTKIREKLA